MLTQPTLLTTSRPRHPGGNSPAADVRTTCEDLTHKWQHQAGSGRSKFLGGWEGSSALVKVAPATRFPFNLVAQNRRKLNCPDRPATTISPPYIRLDLYLSIHAMCMRKSNQSILGPLTSTAPYHFLSGSGRAVHGSATLVESLLSAFDFSAPAAVGRDVAIST